jgi:hypothetical protein
VKGFSTVGFSGVATKALREVLGIRIRLKVFMLTLVKQLCLAVIFFTAGAKALR